MEPGSDTSAGPPSPPLLQVLGARRLPVYELYFQLPPFSLGRPAKGKGFAQAHAQGTDPAHPCPFACFQ